ncbi:MgtC/SapB family protein [Beijerinckia sp. L45]|uniref:MgtC/SapB family protein n=1 Tax=Beijerinckia sp. L45 TaxID=1641855 RepID=UPI00131E86D5|nr:MgtC/SapB family protein [Beijerinckia sp. L45]
MLNHQETILRLVIAAFAGSVVGIERERLQWAAGLRTHMLVCVGSCLVIIVSAYGFADILGNHIVLDPSRIAAQVVSGIGFLGAGTILLRGEVVKGLTTAASLWAVAAIGLAVGSGLYVAALTTTVIVLVILAGLKPIEERVRDRVQSRFLVVTAKRGAMSIAVLHDVLGPRASRVKQFVLLQDVAEELDTIHVTFSRMPSDLVETIATKLRALPFVVTAELS